MSEISREIRWRGGGSKMIGSPPRLIRHFNYSIQENSAYNCVTVKSGIAPGIAARTRYIKQMYAKAHGVQIGHLRIYFSSDIPVGFYHPEVGAMCLDNLWTRQTAYHLNRINRNNDSRMSIDHFFTILNKYLKLETLKDSKLYVPHIDDYRLRVKLENSEYLARDIW